jgi:putative flavoprotein involved in K+ transport
MNGVQDCVVVGAGPAGLAASAALADRGVEHVVLERARPGESWRSQRWDSFRLNTPGWMNRLLGEQPHDAYASAAEVVRRLQDLAGRSPVRAGVGVSRLGPDGDGYRLSTGDGELTARTVVVATGAENRPWIPAVGRALPDRVAQLHVADYRAPGLLPDGAVLVVGSAQSGCQVVEDLLAGGRRVVLATSPVGRVPTPYRGRSTIEWLAEAGFFDQRPQDLPDPAMLRAPNPLLAPGGRAIGLPALARAGVTLTGQLVAVDGERVRFDDSAPANLAAGEAFAGRVRAMVDEIVRRRDLDAPPAEPDQGAVPVELDPPAALDLGAERVGSVIWCTGFGGDFSWLDPAMLDDRGRPRHRDAAVAPGLWCMGLRWMLRRSSNILHGMATDAVGVADAVRAHLGG